MERLFLMIKKIRETGGGGGGRENWFPLLFINKKSKSELSLRSLMSVWNNNPHVSS